jgi:hypothetical protein
MEAHRKESEQDRSGCFLTYQCSSQNGGVTVSTGSIAVERHAGGWAPVIAWKTTIANNQLAYAA